jgi:hypothetical protein
MGEDFIGGLLFPWGQRVGRPGIQLTITKDGIVFRIRYGLGRFFGPWLVERERVASVYLKRGTLTVLSSVKIVEKSGLVWTFWTLRPDEVAQRFEHMGYPVLTRAPLNG